MIKVIKGECLDSNVYVLEKNGQVLIVDCGARVETIKEATCGQKVVGILLTHGHFDHSQHCNDIANYFGCKIYASEFITNTLSDEEAIYSEDKSTITDFSNFVFLKGDGKIRVGDFDVSYYHCPGHSICCECFIVDGDLFAGDVLFDRSIGRTDLKNSDKDMMINSLNKLEKLTFDNVYSGHGWSSQYQEQMRNIAVYRKFLTR